MRETLRHRGFRLLFLAQCASFLGDAIFVVALAFAVLDVTGSGGALGTVLASGAAALVATFLVSGVWADRLPRVRIMVVADVVRLVTQGVLATLLLTERAELWHLVALNIVFNVATAFFQPARTGLVPQLLDLDRLIPANGLMGTAENLMFAIGPAIGGVLVATVGPGWAIAADALTFLVSGILLLAIGRVPSPVRELGSSFLVELADGWREVRSRRWIWWTLLSATAFLLVFEGPLLVVGPVEMDAAYDGARSWGWLLAAGGFGATIGAAIASTGRLLRPILWSVLLFFACPLVPLLLVLDAPLWPVMLAYVVAGASFGLFIPVWDSALQRGVPPSRVSRVSAWDWMCSLAGMPIGMAVTGWLVDAVGRDPVLVGMAALSFLVCVMFLVEPAVRGIDRLEPWTAEPPAGPLPTGSNR